MPPNADVAADVMAVPLIDVFAMKVPVAVPVATVCATRLKSWTALDVNVFERRSVADLGAFAVHFHPRDADGLETVDGEEFSRVIGKLEGDEVE